MSIPLLAAISVIGDIIKGAFGLIDKMVEDKDKANELKTAIQQQLTHLDYAAFETEIHRRAEIIVGEAKGESWLQRNWRPMLMCLFGFIIANNYVIFPYLALYSMKTIPLEVPPDMGRLLKLGIGRHALGWSGEKLVGQVSDNGVGDPARGDVTFGAGVTVNTGHKDSLVRVAPMLQEVDYTEGGKYPADPGEQALNKLTTVDQQLSGQIGRVVTLGIASPFKHLNLPDPVAGTYLRWRNTRGGFENTGSIGVLDPSPTKGDLLARGSTIQRLAVGNQGEVLTVDRSTALGVHGAKQPWYNVKDYGAVGDGVANDSAPVQAAVNAAGVMRAAVYFPPGTYYLPTSVVLTSYVRLVGGGAEGSFIKTAARVTAFTWANGSTLYRLEMDHLGFIGPGTALASTGTYDYLAWAHIHHCDFYATLAEAIHANLILSDIELNDFGWHGNPGGSFRAIYSKGNYQNNTTNINRIRRNSFYQCKGSECIYFEAGYMLDLSENDFEANHVTTACVVANGLFNVLNRGNWFERNITPSLVSLATDSSATIGDYVIRFDTNWFSLDASTAQVANIAGALKAVEFINNSGTNMAGKHLTLNGGQHDGGITTYYGNYFVGYSRLNQFSGPLTIAPAENGTLGSINASGGITAHGSLSVINDPGNQFRGTNVANGSGGDISLGINVNAGGRGGAYLILASSQSRTGANTHAALYLIKCGYDGNNFTAIYIAGDVNFVTFSQSGGVLHASATDGANYAILANF